MQPRKREYIWAGITLALAVLWAGGGDYADALNADTAVKEARAHHTECQRYRDNAERYAKALAHVLNGGRIATETTAASCRVKHTEKS
jgi:hypothetical protein